MIWLETELKYKLLQQLTASELLKNKELAALIPASSCRHWQMHSSYLDTKTALLRTKQAVLRQRQEGKDTVLTIKLASQGENNLQMRPEWNISLTAPLSKEELKGGVDLQGLFATALQRADRRQELEQITSLLSKEPLLIVCEAKFERFTWDFTYGDASIELAFDSGYLAAATRREKILELELELKQGSIESLLAAGNYLEKKLPLLPEYVSKYGRCLALMQA